MEPVHYSAENVIHHTNAAIIVRPQANHASFDVTNGTFSPNIVTKIPQWTGAHTREQSRSLVFLRIV